MTRLEGNLWDRYRNRGYYMSAHVLWNLLNKFGKSDKMRGFRNEFNEFKITQAQILDSIYHATFTLFCYHAFAVKTSRFCQI